MSMNQTKKQLTKSFLSNLVLQPYASFDLGSQCDTGITAFLSAKVREINVEQLLEVEKLQTQLAWNLHYYSR